MWDGCSRMSKTAYTSKASWEPRYNSRLCFAGEVKGLRFEWAENLTMIKVVLHGMTNTLRNPEPASALRSLQER